MSQAEAYAVLGIDQPDSCKTITVSIAHWTMMSQEERRDTRWDFDQVIINVQGYEMHFDEVGRGDKRAHEDAWKNDGGIVKIYPERSQETMTEMFHAFAKVSGIDWYWINGNEMIVNEMDAF